MAASPKPNFLDSENEVDSKEKKVLTSSERSLVYKVYKYFDCEKNEGKPKFRIDAVLTKTCAATGVSANTVRKIIESAPDFSTPGKKRPRLQSPKFGKIDDFDLCALRRIVHSFFLRKEQPCLESLHSAAVASLEFPYSKEYLRQLLTQIGFVYKRRKTNNALKERSDVVVQRLSYLRSIRE